MPTETKHTSHSFTANLSGSLLSEMKINELNGFLSPMHVWSIDGFNSNAAHYPIEKIENAIAQNRFNDCLKPYPFTYNKFELAFFSNHTNDKY
jgi:hypothetical protein